MAPSLLVTAFVILLSVISAGAQAAAGFKATEVFKGSTTIKGQALQYPATNQPEVTALLVDLEPGGESERHQHPSAPYIYVIEGTFTVEFDDGTQQSFQAGQGFLEAVNTWHKARNLGATALKFMVVFTGEQGKSNFIKP
ncbi:MAG: cupin domain-containing protein [Gammaproteobacteria bacterium]|nr:cupin domain-containing protein [Gammaproteobacteria bacterium]